MKWENRPRVKNCPYREIVDCPKCGLGEACNHEDAGGFECTPENCPLWNGVRWKKENANATP